jgi:hypothetical protein
VIPRRPRTPWSSGAFELRHPPELLDDVGRLVRRVELAVHGFDVDGDPAELAERGELLVSADRRAMSRAASKASIPASWRAPASCSTKAR